MSEQFSKLRSFLWPIYKSELRKFLPILIIFFLVGFNYSILRATKDALVVTAPSSGAEALPFLKVWAILPMAFLFTFLFTRVSNKLSRERVFYAMMSIFLVFFALFTFVLYPFRDFLHPHALADRMQDALPIGCKGLIAIFRNWTFTAFYVMAEMWSTIIMTVLCWGFVNEVTTVKDAKRFYGLLGIGINFSGIAAGQVATSLSQHVYNPQLPFGTDAWGQSIFFLNCIVVIAGLICVSLFRWLHSSGFGYSSAPGHMDAQEIKMGLRKNFAYLAKSKYLICIAVIVVMYNIAINLLEVVWKNQVKQLYPNPNDFNAYMGKVLTAIGVIATITSIFISGNVIRRLSWTASAMISPLIILVTGVGFFSFLLFQDYGLGLFANLLGTTPLMIGVFFGSLQNALARASKYTLFDATKERAFIPLSKESKLKGKAAIDGVGSRLGKSGGSLIHQGLLVFFGTISLSTPYVALILLIAIGAWMIAVKALGKRFNQLTSHHEMLQLADDEIPSSSETIISTESSSKKEATLNV
jgi:ATP:ADP antiporter, AAA family